MLKLEQIAPLLRDPLTHGSIELLDDYVVVPGTETRYSRDRTLIDFVGDEEFGSSEEHYEKLPFDTVDWSSAEARKNAVEPELRELLPDIPREAIIFDVGCGPGRTTVHLNETGHQVIAVDLTRTALDELRGHVEGLPCLRANNLNLPVADGVADWVISTGVVHHTPNPRQAIAENCRILKPGGRLYLRLFNRDGYYRIMYCYLGGMMRLLRRNVVGKAMVYGVCRPIYKAVHSRSSRRHHVPREKLNALFENYFMKGTVTLSSKAEIDSCLATANMQVTDYSVRSTMHCYIAEKKA